MIKKLLTSSLASIAIFTSFISTANTFAAELGSYSADVTIGEVDKINTDVEEQNIHTPETGVFGLESNSGPVIAATFITMPITVFIIFLFKRTRHN